jgi:mannobiose 2-epimerase
MANPAAELRTAIQDELDRNLLPFWRERSVDVERGGFIGEMANNGALRPEAPKGLILNSRILWTFAALYRNQGDARDLSLARRACEYLLNHFEDPRHGGFFWRLDPVGRPLDESKKIYGQAFCIYALSEYHLASGESQALEEAKEMFRLIEEHAHDDSHGGYIETLAADWSPAADLRLSEKDLDVAKSMNNHLHLLEAYTNLFRAWSDPGVEERLHELIDLFERHILSRTAEGCHVQHFFDEEWNVCSQDYSYGHDIEAAWLLCEAATVLGDANRQAAVGGWALELARSVLREALDEEGGLAYAGRGGEVTDPNREWWPQAEAVVGFWQAYALSGEVAFAEAAERVWGFISSSVVDREHGEWFWRIRAGGSVDQSEPKVSEWKGPYHNTRMCLEMIERIGDQEQG